MLFRLKAGITAASLFAIFIGPQAHALQNFYEGRTIDLIVSTGVGGALDTNARLVAQYWAKHIPGNPKIVVLNMPGAGHVRAANFLANEAPRDGTVLGTFVPAFLLAQVLKTTSAIKFDAAKFNWLGASTADNSTFYVWRTAPVRTMQDAMKTVVLMGATGAGSYTVIYPTIMNAIVGTKFKVISGYATTQQINLALQRGEVQGRAGNNFNSLKVENGDWLRDGSIRLLAQVGLERDSEFPNLPLMLEFGRTPQEKTLLRLFSADIAVGRRPFVTSPGVPQDRVDLLRRAFDATMKDPLFLSAAKASGVDIRPVSGEKLQKIVAEIVATPPDIVAIARAAMQTSAETGNPAQTSVKGGDGK